MRILGIGNALTDYLFRLDSDDILTKLNLPKGSMQLVDKAKSDEILQLIGISPEHISAGGSAANTIHGLANLGVETAFIGKIGNDDHGNMFRNSLENANIQPLLFNSTSPSGVAIALISPDGERTFATYLGAAVEMSEVDLESEMFEDYDLVHIEGYLVQNHQLVKKIMSICEDLELKVSLDMASYNVVNENKAFLQEIITNYAHIVFANEDEAFEFANADPEKSLDKLSELCEIAIVKIGSQGSLLRDKRHSCKVEAFPATCLDTTGAGDLYASGFLYGYINSMKLSQCGEIASMLAGHIIEELGAKIPHHRWQIVRETLGLV